MTRTRDPSSLSVLEKLRGHSKTNASKARRVRRIFSLRWLAWGACTTGVFVLGSIFTSNLLLLVGSLLSCIPSIKQSLRGFSGWWHLRKQRVALLEQNERLQQGWRNRLLKADWRQEKLPKKTVFRPPIHISENGEVVPDSLREIRPEVVYQYKKPPSVGRRVSHQISRKTATHATVFGVAILCLFLAQFITSIPSGEPYEPVSSQNPPGGHFLQIDHSIIISDGDGVFEFNAFNQTLMVCYIKGAELINFSINDGGTEPQSFFATDGLNWWAMEWGDEERPYSVSFNLDDLPYIDSFAVQPVFLAEGKVNYLPGETRLTQIPFDGLGDISVLIWTFMNFDDLIVNLDGVPLKEVDIGFDIRTTAVVALQDGTALRFDSWVSAGSHELEIGGGNFSYCVVSQYDTDGDLIDDATEMEHYYDKGTYPEYPDIWGTQYDVSENITDALDKDSLSLEGVDFWQRHSLEFYIPGAYAEETNFVFIEAYSGIFKQFEIDGDAGISCANITLMGSSTAATEIITVEDVSGYEYTGEAWQFSQQDSYCAGVLQPGWHEINYLSKAQLFIADDIRFRINDYYILLWDSQTLAAPETDSDGDSVPDGTEDLSPANYIDWQFPQIHQLVLPVDESGTEDVEVIFQVVRPENERNIMEPFIWHKQEVGELKCRLVPAMRLFGSSDPADPDYWYKSESFTSYWGENGAPRTIQTYNLVLFDSAGNYYDPNMDLEVIPGADPYAYYTFLTPSIAGKVYEYKAEYPHDCPAFADGALSIFYDFCYLVVNENWDNDSTSILHVYDYEPTESLRISGIGVKTYSSVNGLAASPSCHIDERALLMLNQNPAMDNGVNFEWDQELRDARLTQFTDGHLFASWEYDARDPTTWSASERLERGSMEKTISHYSNALYFESGCLTAEEGWGTSPNFLYEAGAPYISDYYGMTDTLRIDLQPNKVANAWYSFDDTFASSTTGSVSFNMIWNMDSYSYDNGQLWFGLGHKGEDIASIHIYQGDILYGEDFIGSLLPRTWVRVDFRYDLVERQVDLYINNVLQKADLPFLTNGIPDELLIHGIGAGPTNIYPIPIVTGCIDNVQFSWNYATFTPTWAGKDFVEYLTMTQGVLDPLNKLLLDMKYDQQTHQEFMNYQGTWDFAGALSSSGWVPDTTGTGQASIIPYKNTHENVAEIESFSDSEWFGISHPINTPRVDGEVGFYFNLDPASCPSLRILLGESITSPGIELVAQDGKLSYIDPVQGLVEIADVWYGTFFSLNIAFDCTDGTYDVFLSTPGYCNNENLPFLTRLSDIHAISFQSLGGTAYLDAIWCNWTGDFQGQYLPLSLLKAGDANTRVSISTIKDVYNGTVQKDGPELLGDNVRIWEDSWSTVICDHEEISIDYLPIKVNIDRASVSGKLQTHDRLKITYASGLVSPADLPLVMNLVAVPSFVRYIDELTLETTNEWTGEGFIGLPPTIHFNDVNGDLCKISTQYSSNPSEYFTQHSLPDLFSIPIVSSGVTAGRLNIGFYTPSEEDFNSPSSAGYTTNVDQRFKPRSAPVVPFPTNPLIRKIYLAASIDRIVDNFADLGEAKAVTEFIFEKIRAWEALNLPSSFQTILYKEGLGEWFTDVRADVRVLIQLGIKDASGKSWVPETITRFLMEQNRQQYLLGLTNYERYCTFLSPDWLTGIDDPYVYLSFGALPKIDPVTHSVAEFQGATIVDLYGNFHVLSGTWEEMEPLLLKASQESLDDLATTGGFLVQNAWDIALPRTFTVNVLSEARDPGTLNALFRSIYAHKAEPFSWSSVKRMGGKPEPWKFRSLTTGTFGDSAYLTKSNYWKIIANSPSVGTALPGLNNPLVGRDAIQELPDLSGKYLDDLGWFTSQVDYGVRTRGERALMEFKLELKELEDRLATGTWVHPDGTLGTADNLRDLRYMVRTFEDQLQYRTLPRSSNIEIWDDNLKEMVNVPRSDLYAKVFGAASQRFDMPNLKGYGFPGTLFTNPNPGKMTDEVWSMNPKNWWPDNDIFMENHKAFSAVSGVSGAPKFWGKVYPPYFIAPQFKNTYHKGTQAFARFYEVQKAKISVGKSVSGTRDIFGTSARKLIKRDSEDSFRMIVILSGVVGCKDLTPEQALFVYWKLRSILELYDGPNGMIGTKLYPSLSDSGVFFNSANDRLAAQGVDVVERWRLCAAEVIQHPDLTPFTQAGARKWNEIKNMLFGVTDEATMEKWFGRLGYHSGYPGGPEQFFLDHRGDLPWEYRSKLIADKKLADMEAKLRPDLEAIDISKLDFYQRWLDWIGQEWMDYFYPKGGGPGKLPSFWIAGSLSGEGPNGPINSAYGHTYIHDYFAKRLGVAAPDSKVAVGNFNTKMKRLMNDLEKDNRAGRSYAGWDLDHVTDVKMLAQWQKWCVNTYDHLRLLIYWQKKGVGDRYLKYNEFMEDPFGKYVEPETLAELDEVGKIYKMDVTEMISNIRYLKAAQEGCENLITHASLYKPDIWDAIGNIIGIFVDIMMDWGQMTEQVEYLKTEHGWSEEAAWAYALDIWSDKWLWEAAVSSIVDLTIGTVLAEATYRYVYVHMLENCWSLKTAGFAASLSKLGVSMAIATIVALIIGLVWDFNHKEQLRFEAEWTTDLVVDFQPEIKVPSTTQKSLNKHLSLTVGDSIEIQTSIENKGELYWDWEPPSIFNGFQGHFVKRDEASLATSGAPFWLRARYAFDKPDQNVPEAQWSNWVGQWNTGAANDHIPPMVGYGYAIDSQGSAWTRPFEWDIYTFASGTALYHTPAQTYTSSVTFTKAMPSVTWYIQQQVASTYNRRTDHGANIAAIPVEGMRVCEGTLSGFLANCVRVPVEEETSSKILAFQSMLEGYNWSQAMDLGQEILPELEAMTLGFSEEEFLDLVSRVKDLSDADAPAQYRNPTDNRLVAFSASEKEEYSLLTFDSRAEFDNFFKQSYKGASTFTDLGFRVPCPEWSRLTSTTIAQDFSEQNYPDFPTNWIGTLTNSYLQIWQGDEIGAPATFYSYTGDGSIDSWCAGVTGYKYAAINGLNGYGKWIGKSIGLAPKGTAEISMMGPCPVGYSTREMPYTIGLGYWDGSALTDITSYKIIDADEDGTGVVQYGGGYNSLEMIPMTKWNVFRLEWDYTAGSAGECGFRFQTSYNGEHHWVCPFGLSGYNENSFITDKIPNVFFIRVDAPGGLGWVCFDDVRITTEGSYFASNAFAYLGYSSTSSQLLVPKAWIERMARCYNLIDDLQYALDHIPIDAEIEAKSTWGDVLEVGPNNPTVTSLAIDIRASSSLDPQIEWEIAAPNGYDISPRSGTCNLHSLSSITFSIDPQNTAVVGIYPFAFHVYLQAEDRTEIYAKEFTFRYANYKGLSLDKIPIGSTPYVWGEEKQFATLINKGNSPEWIALEIEGLPKEWLYSRGYYNTEADILKYYDFTAGTQGFSSGISTSTGLFLRSNTDGVIYSSTSSILDLQAGDQIRVLYKWVGSPDAQFRLMRSEVPVYDLALSTGMSGSTAWKEFSFVLPEDAIFDGMDLVLNCQSGDSFNVLWICIDRPIVVPETVSLYKASFADNLPETLWDISRAPDLEVLPWNGLFTIDWMNAVDDVFADESSPRVNFGKTSQLQVTPSGGGTQKVAYIQRPDVPYLLDGASLRLKLWNTLGVSGRILVYETTSFVGSDVTWSHQPLFGNLVANVTVMPGENEIPLDSTAYAFALVALEETEDWGEGASFFSTQNGAFGPQFAWEVPNLWQGDGALYMQADELASWSLLSPVLQSLELTSEDWVYVRFADNSTSEVSLSFLSGGNVQAEFILGPAGEVFEKLHWRRFQIPSSISIDQVRVCSSLSDGEFVFIDELSFERPRVYEFIQANVGGSYNETVPLGELNCQVPVAKFTGDGWSLDNGVIQTFTQQLLLTESDVVDSWDRDGSPGWLRELFTALLYRSDLEYRTYFRIPDLPIAYANPSASLMVYWTAASPYGGETSLENCKLNVAPARGSFQEGQISWNNQPGYDSGGVIWQLTGADVPAVLLPNTWSPITGLNSGVTYCMYVTSPLTASDACFVRGDSDESLSFPPYAIYTMEKLTSVNGSLVLQTDVSERLTASRLVDISLPTGGQAHVQFRGSVTSGVSIKFFLTGDESLEWALSPPPNSYPVERVFSLPSGSHIIGIEISGDFDAGQQFLMDYLTFDEEAEAQSLQEIEWRGYRDVLRVTTFGSAQYSFDAPRLAGSLEFWLGGRGNCTVVVGDGITFGLTNDRWWFADGKEIRYTDHLHTATWEYVRLTWDCDASFLSPDTFSLTFGNDSLTALTGCLMATSPFAVAVDSLRFTAGSGDGWRLDALACGWQLVSGPRVLAEGESPSQYIVGSNFGENIFENGTGQLTFLAPGHWREYYLDISKDWSSLGGTYACFAKFTNVYSRECVGKLNFTISIPVFLESKFVATGPTNLIPGESGYEFLYNFTLENLGNAPQIYVVSTTDLEPYAIPSFSAPGIQGARDFEVSLKPGQLIGISLNLLSVVPALRDFSVNALSLTAGTEMVIPASYFVNQPPIVTSSDDVVYEQGMIGNELSWTISDTSPVPNWQNDWGNPRDWYGIYSNTTSAAPDLGEFWATYTFDAPPYFKLPAGWSSSDLYTGQVNSGRLYVYGGLSQDEYHSAWLPIGDQTQGAVEWYMFPSHGLLEVGLFRDGVPIATVSASANLDGQYVLPSVNGIAMPSIYDYFSLTFDSASGSFNIHAHNSAYSSTIYWDRSNIAFANNLVPNEFRVRIIGHGIGYVMGMPVEYGGSGSIDALGLSWDPTYQLGDNERVRLVEAGTYDPSGDVLSYNVDGLMANPAVGMSDYKFIFIASDGMMAADKDIRVVRVLTPNPVIVPVTGEISYEYGTAGHSLGWQVFDAFAPAPTFEIWRAGAELPGQYCGSESFQDVPQGGIPAGWSRSDPAKIGVVAEWESHTKCLQVQSWDENIDSTLFSFPAQSTGTIEWYMYWGMGGFLSMSFGDTQGTLAEVGVNSYMDRFEVYNTGSCPFWYPYPQSSIGWHRFAFVYNALTGQYSITVYTPGILGWTGGWQPKPYGGALSYSWSGTFSRQAQGLTYMSIASQYGQYGQLANWVFDSIGLSWDPLYDVGDLVNLEREMIPVTSGTWASGDICQISVDDLDIGTHEYTFVAWDGNGASTGKVSSVQVFNVQPVLTDIPENMTFLTGTLVPSLEWTPSDHSTRGATYSITEEGVGEVAGGLWISGQSIVWNPFGLPVGIHHIVLELNDGLGGLVQNEVEVIVNDQVAFLGTPLDFSYHVGEEIFNIQWNVADMLALNPSYNVYLRGFEGETGLGTLFTSGTWNSGVGSSILVNMGGVPVGLYIASMVMSDGLGAQATDQVVFFVTPPEMNPLDWLESSLVEAGADMSCGTISGDVAVDLVFDTSEDTQMAIGIWDAPPQVEGPDFATEGTYFTVDAEREEAVTFPIFVTVTLPGGFPAGMTESDVAAWLRFLFFDEVSETWVDPQFPIVAIDMVAGSATFEVWHLSIYALGFANGLPPKIDGPGGLSYEYNSLEPQQIIWRLADLTVGVNPSYSIFLDGVLITQGPWSFGTEVVIDASGFPVGTYHYEIIAFDDLGGVNSLRVPVNVFNVAPVISSPDDITYEAGSSGNVITWVPTDFSSYNPVYIIIVDGTQINTGTWSSGIDITASVDGLMQGAHVVELTLADGLGESITDQVLVVVTNAEPIITAPLVITYEDGDSRPMASWLIEDSSVLDGTFDLLRNGILISSGVWASGIPLEFNVGGLAPGVVTYQLVARDGYGAVNEALASVIVLPDDDASVTIANLSAAATPFNVTVVFTDVDPAGIASVEWVSMNETAISNFAVVWVGGQWVVTFDYAFPQDGLYEVELQVTDADADRPGDQASQIFEVSINVTGCDPIKNLMEGVLAQINLLKVDINRVDCWVWRELLAFFAGRAESSMIKAFDLYLAGNVPAATVRVWIAQCAMYVDDILVQVGRKIGVIDPNLALELDGHITCIQVNLKTLIQLLAG